MRCAESQGQLGQISQFCKPTSVSELHFKEIGYRCLKIKLSLWSSNDEDSGSTVFWVWQVIKKESAKTKEELVKAAANRSVTPKGRRNFCLVYYRGWNKSE